MTITSHPATDDYRAGRERVFGKKPDFGFVSISEYKNDVGRVAEIGSYVGGLRIANTERRLVWSHINGSPFAIRRFVTMAPLIEGAAYGTKMKERRVLSDRRK